MSEHSVYGECCVLTAVLVAWCCADLLIRARHSPGVEQLHDDVLSEAGVEVVAAGDVHGVAVHEVVA